MTPQPSRTNASRGLAGTRYAGVSLQVTLAALAAGRDVACGTREIATAVRDSAASEEEPHARTRHFCEVARRVNLRAEVRSLSLEEAVRYARRHGPLATPWILPARWLIVTGGGWFGVRVMGGEQLLQTLSRRELQGALGEPASKLPWVEVDPALPCDAAAAKQHGHSAHGQSHLKPLQRLFHLLKPDWQDIGVVILFAAVIGVLSLATPLAVESLVNTIAFGRLVQPIIVLCCLLFVFLAFAAALKVLQTYIAEIIQRRIFVRVVADLAHRLPRVKRTALDEIHGPELLNRFFDVMTVQKSAALLVLDGVSLALQVAVGMLVLAFYHPLLLGFDVLLIGLMTGMVLLLGRGGVRTSIEESRAKYDVAAWLEQLAGVNTAVKSAGGPQRAISVADALAGQYVTARQAHFRVLLRQMCFALGLQAVAGSVLLGIGGWLVISGQLTLGQLVAAELIVAVIIGSFTKLDKHLESFYDLLAAVEKLGHLFDLPMEPAAGRELAIQTGPAAVRVQEASYEFHHGDHALSPLTLLVNPGQMVAVQGRPGCGKSTLLDLIYGLREPTHGFVEVDGEDLRGLAPDSIRLHSSLVRNIEFFTGSVFENLQLDRDEVSAHDIRAALSSVGLVEELRDLPQGLDTQLQPGGAPLSDSQARRLVLARALVGRPRLLLIDNLLDALPDDCLPRVMHYLQTLREETTVIIVTGRKEIAQLCDRVFPFGGPSSGDQHRHHSLDLAS